MKTWLSLLVAIALAGCARAGTDALNEHGTVRTLSVAGTPNLLADCLTTKLDEDDLAGIKVTRSRILPNGAIELQGKHHTGVQLIWMALLTATGPSATRVDLTTRNFAYIDMSGDEVAAHIQGKLATCAKG
ncbi:MAG: hypothetical protein JF625_27925 [Inquilinus limosus]|uniref:Lipoprotein n=1 Tax=Inquilinus limosus TaxID=171674 RepID=A0A952KG26_9PROT|nr:hypothetical protein [Inquilinus limosus]